MLTKASASATSYQGDIEISYDELVALFGEPHVTMGDKTTAEWCFEWGGTIFTIYDYYCDSTPKGVYDWHIGGHDEKAVTAVQMLFPWHKVQI